MARRSYHINVKVPAFPFGLEYVPDNSQPTGNVRVANAEGPVLPLDIKNVLPTSYGMINFFSPVSTNSKVPISTEYVFIYRTAQGNNVLVALGIFGAMFSTDGITWDVSQAPVVDADFIDDYTSPTLTLGSLASWLTNHVNDPTPMIDANSSLSGVVGRVHASVTITNPNSSPIIQQLVLNIDPVDNSITAVDSKYDVSNTYTLSGISPDGSEEIINVPNIAGAGIIKYTLVDPAAVAWLAARAIMNPWSYAIVRNTLYCYRQGLGYILSLSSIPVIWTIVNPTFINLPLIKGIFGARSRLGAWDSDDSIYTSSPNDVSDFTPSLKTQSNVVKADALVGRIINILPIANGFIIYATSSIVLAQYKQPSTGAVFAYTAISKDLGIIHRHSVILGEAGVHFALTGAGLQAITTTAAVSISPALDEYIASSTVAPRLDWLDHRRLSISITPSVQVGTIQFKQLVTPGLVIPGTSIDAPLTELPIDQILSPAQRAVLPEFTDPLGITPEPVYRFDLQLLTVAPQGLHPASAAYGFDVSTAAGALSWYEASGLVSGNYPASWNKLQAGFTPYTVYVKLALIPVMLAIQAAVNQQIMDRMLKAIIARATAGDLFHARSNWENQHQADLPTHTTYSQTGGAVVNKATFSSLDGRILNAIVFSANASTAYLTNANAVFLGSSGSGDFTGLNIQNIPLATLPVGTLVGVADSTSALSLQPSQLDPLIALIPGLPFEISELVYPDTVYTASFGDTEPITPVYTRAIILDTKLKAWGSCDSVIRQLVDYSPINARNYNPILKTTDTKFTYQNLASTIVMELASGELKLATAEGLVDSYVSYGKLSYTRTGITRFLDAVADLAIRTDATLEIFDASGRLIVSGVQDNNGVLQVFKVANSAWYILRVRGKYQLKGLLFSGELGGNR